MKFYLPASTETVKLTCAVIGLFVQAETTSFILLLLLIHKPSREQILLVYWRAAKLHVRHSNVIICPPLPRNTHILTLTNCRDMPPWTWHFPGGSGIKIILPVNHFTFHPEVQQNPRFWLLLWGSSNTTSLLSFPEFFHDSWSDRCESLITGLQLCMCFHLCQNFPIIL